MGLVEVFEHAAEPGYLEAHPDACEAVFGSAASARRYGAFGPGELAGTRRELNLRELGGYEVAGGGKVKHGLLLRGPRLTALDSSEFALVEGLGLRSIIDFRSAVEAAASPDSALAGATHTRVAGMYLAGTGEEVDFSPQQLSRLGVAAEGARDEASLRIINNMMLSSYVGMPYDNPGVQALFAALLEGGPVYFHCTSGKDRTGVAAMLILLALGASREDAVFDFALTNAYRAKTIHRAYGEHPEALSADYEAARLVMLGHGVDPSMTEAVIDGILARSGSFEAYFAKELQLGPAELELLRELYVE